jgi:hypothetical protein
MTTWPSTSTSRVAATPPSRLSRLYVIGYVSGYAPMIFDLDLGRINETAAAPLERVTEP